MIIMSAHAGGAGRARAGAARIRRSAARGLTLLEVMFAVVLLTLVAISVSSTISFLVRVQADDRQRLGAYELANRKILEYLDDAKSIGAPVRTLSPPQEIYGFRYRWQLDDNPVTMTVKPSEAAARSASQLPVDRFKQITVTVWLVDERASRDGSLAVKGDEVARLSRVCDPTFGQLFRNPDSRNNGITNGELLQKIMRTFGGANGGANRPGPPASTTPPPASPPRGRGA